MNNAVRRVANLAIGAILLFFATALVAQTTPSTTPDSPSVALPFGPPVKDNSVLFHIWFDQFEDRTNGPDNSLRWDGEGWIGTDMNKLWIKSEGFTDGQSVSDGDVEAFYDRPIPHMRYFDGQVGLRQDTDSGPARTWAAVGIEGLAPYYFQFAPTLYVRNGGNVAGRMSGMYDLLITQRLIVQPEAELDFYNNDDRARRIGSGLSELDTGVRLRYEISRKFAPYIGFAFNGKFGNTAVYARQAGEPADQPTFVFGLRVWY